MGHNKILSNKAAHVYKLYKSWWINNCIWDILEWKKLAIAISMVALFDSQTSMFIVDIVLWEKKANKFCLLPLTEVEVLVPADADEKGLLDEGDKADNHSPWLHASSVDSQQQIPAAMPRTHKYTCSNASLNQSAPYRSHTMPDTSSETYQE
jgi:hypothetical protein